MDRVPALAREASKRARRYEFRTFSVGVSLPQAVQEREDELRADLKLKGSETIKTQAAKELGELVAGALRKRVDKMRPDVNLLANFGTGEVIVSSRPVFYYGRYTKPSKVSQRTELCRHCGGSGCKRCRNTGYEQGESVEKRLRSRLATFTGSDRVTFTWLGSEDRNSRVYPPGRPFVAEIKNPLKLHVPRKFLARFRGGQVSVASGKVLASKPVRLPRFRFRTRIVGRAARKVSREDLDALALVFRGTQVRFERPHDRPVTKTVYKASATAQGNKLTIDAELDGGLPVKRFVSGDLVSPSVSEVLKTEVRCRSFDICGVKETSRFEFAEVSRVKKKN